jgi:hypothetical protein
MSSYEDSDRIYGETHFIDKSVCNHLVLRSVTFGFKASDFYVRELFIHFKVESLLAVTLPLKN